MFHVKHFTFRFAERLVHARFGDAKTDYREKQVRGPVMHLFGREQRIAQTPDFVGGIRVVAPKTLPAKRIACISPVKQGRTMPPGVASRAVNGAPM
jgi:hypothetical protein